MGDIKRKNLKCRVENKFPVLKCRNISICEAKVESKNIINEELWEQKNKSISSTANTITQTNTRA